MALFRRTPKNSVLPEVDKYYEGERRDRAGLAWLLALVSVALVALVLVGAFLGGRWAYRQITDNDNDEVAITDNTAVPSFDGAQDAADEPTAPAADEQEEEQADGTVNAPARTDTPSTPPATTPSTGDNAPLPNTGPADTAAVFLTVSVIAAALHSVLSRKRVNG